jgi:hypothetical protein
MHWTASTRESRGAGTDGEHARYALGGIDYASRAQRKPMLPVELAVVFELRAPTR